MSDRLTPRQERFAREYVTARSGAEAARKAGYSEKIDDVAASRNIRNDKVAKRIRELTEPKREEEEQLRQQVIEKLVQLGINGAAEKEANQVRSLELLGKAYGLFIERHSHDFEGEKRKVLEAVEGLCTDLYELIPDDLKAEAGEVIARRLAGLSGDS